jgi:hypothetical protein
MPPAIWELLHYTLLVGYTRLRRITPDRIKNVSPSQANERSFIILNFLSDQTTFTDRVYEYHVPVWRSWFWPCSMPRDVCNHRNKHGKGYGARNGVRRFSKFTYLTGLNAHLIHYCCKANLTWSCMVRNNLSLYRVIQKEVYTFKKLFYKNYWH